MSGTAGEVRIAREACTRADDRIPVRRHVIERRIGLDQLHAGESREAPLDPRLHIADEVVVRAGFIVVRIDVKVILREAAADDEAALAERPIITGIDRH